ncbi:FAD-binding oxidoreductase [Streptomyces cylindrosporus]|uniref:FAD-binding oxidoreductase n=1 Tax=Streptomyces cylindrosporus TaxID=2927583 RepID=A0ABS9Y928_9ACTN|nr:FAD-binding oxidoreductase [Streptomyces cylindrosporus]MCI3273464.1 FAD-binding oxidoreductase [Streptomyces cylindrosporus]
MSTKIVPAGLSSAELEKALDAFRAVVGEAHVLTGEDALEFRDPFWHRDWPEFESSAVVQPASVEEIQAILRIANEQRVPIWTTSTGRNNGLGGSSPRVQGSVVVNLRRMNQILEINEELGYAVVEPGVTWSQLYEAIEAGGHRLMVSTTDLGWGSVIGNSLEHGTTYLPYGADFMAPCGMEVVTADGKLLRTGMGALPGSKAWHLYRRGLGPTLDPLFMQSNFGVVVKMGVWLMPKPEVYAPFWIHVPREADLVPLMDTLRRLRLDRTIEGVPSMYNTLTLASITGERSRWYEGDGPTPDHIVDQIAGDLQVGRWSVHGALWDDNVVADHKIEKITAAIGRIPGARVLATKHAPEDIAGLESFPDRVLGGAPNLEWLNFLRWYGTDAGAHTGTGLVSALEGIEAFRLHTLLKNFIEREMGLDYFANPILINARSYIHVFGVIFDVLDASDTRRGYEVCRRVVEDAGKAGFGEYRAHLANMDLAQAQYSFGDQAYLRFVERIKDAVDPNGILSPGKQGIWPKSFRDGRD